jgi:tetratricopeptide (TPR) repeat protein
VEGNRGDAEMISRKAIVVATVVITLLIWVGGLSWQLATGQIALAATDAAKVAGSEACAGCHQSEAKLWRTSQHERAMAHATDRSVLGNFNDASFQYFDVRSRFFRKDGKFFVETDGPDGKLAAFEVKYTFGVDPLQQYLIEFPDGRLQALSIAWDSRPKEKGGQRWFHLYPNEQIKHDDVLHWTRLNQNWNFMCAECHSTDVRKNYDAAADRFATTWTEISVGCEACHGAGSRHIAWTQEQKRWWPFGKTEDPTKGLAVQFDERSGTTWTPNAKTGLPQRHGMPLGIRKEVETCGLCHARRAQFSEKWTPGQSLSNTHLVTPMYRNLTYADGQMRDIEEIYNYLPFKQSKMFASGVTCSDCHDPHSAALRAPGDGVCGQCHMPSKYETALHRHHENVNVSIPCSSCHMPERTYMVVDKRHDHGFRVPRPDLSVKFGTPNACNDCHRNKSAQWAASAVEGWFGPQREGVQTYAAAFHSAWTEQPNAGKLLGEVASDGNIPAIVRASALIELGPYLSRANLNLAQNGLSDSDPMVRMAALEMLSSVPANQLWPIVSPLLSDPVEAVRIRAVSMLAPVPAASQPDADRSRFETAAAEFVAAQRLNAERPEARVTLANFLAQRGQAAEAEAEYKAALRLNPQFAPAAINLADLYRTLGREDEGLAALREGATAAPRDAGLHHALGLALVRQKKTDEALAELRRAVDLAPDQAQYSYVYAVGLHSAGRVDDAIAALKENLSKHPDNRDSLLAITSFYRDAGNFAAALEYAQRLAKSFPDDRRISGLVDALRRQMESAPR